MPLLRVFLLSSLTGFSVYAQTVAGIAPAWDVRANMTQLAGQAQRYKAVVDQLAVQDWVNRGASVSYLRQQQTVQTEVGHLRTVSTILAEQPERLSMALDALFRLQALETLTVSLSEAASRYQNQKLADDLNNLITENANSRAKLRQYVMDLSVTKEQEYSTAEKEAHRCQEVLNRNPLAPAPVMSPAVKAPARRQDKK